MQRRAADWFWDKNNSVIVVSKQKALLKNKAFFTFKNT